MSESCDEYCSVHRHKVVKARKEHKCTACRAAIHPGDYYATVFACSPDGSDSYKRCGSCEVTWQHLKKLCDEDNRRPESDGCLYPMEDLGCGKRYEDEWGDIPDEIAALPLLSAEERGRLLAPKGEEP